MIVYLDHYKERFTDNEMEYQAFIFQIQMSWLSLYYWFTLDPSKKKIKNLTLAFLLVKDEARKAKVRRKPQLLGLVVQHCNGLETLHPFPGICLQHQQKKGRVSQGIKSN